MNTIPIENFIETLREADSAIATVFKGGACYQFARVLQSLYPNGELMINTERDHVGYLYDSCVYDIDGRHSNSTDWHLMEDKHHELARKWSFSRNSFLQVGECPACDEPLLA